MASQSAHFGSERWMIYLYALSAALITWGLTGWILVVFAAAQTRLERMASVIGAVARLLAAAGSGTAILCIFWAPIFMRYTALQEQREIDPMVVYGVAFVGVAWVALRILSTARRPLSRPDKLN